MFCVPICKSHVKYSSSTKSVIFVHVFHFVDFLAAATALTSKWIDFSFNLQCKLWYKYTFTRLRSLFSFDLFSTRTFKSFFNEQHEHKKIEYNKNFATFLSLLHHILLHNRQSFWIKWISHHVKFVLLSTTLPFNGFSSSISLTKRKKKISSTLTDELKYFYQTKRRIEPVATYCFVMKNWYS